jgi:hypothetical protein
MLAGAKSVFRIPQECRVGPVKASDHALLAAFDAFFARPDVVSAALPIP